jgi:hypothetical protein
MPAAVSAAAGCQRGHWHGAVAVGWPSAVLCRVVVGLRAGWCDVAPVLVGRTEAAEAD